jgi:hypothetical protein
VRTQVAELGAQLGGLRSLVKVLTKRVETLVGPSSSRTVRRASLRMTIGEIATRVDEVADQVGPLRSFGELEHDMRELALMLGEVAGRLAPIEEEAKPAEGNLPFVHRVEFDALTNQIKDRQQYLLGELDAVREAVAEDMGDFATWEVVRANETTTIDALHGMAEAADQMRVGVQSTTTRLTVEHELRDSIVVKLARQVDLMQTYLKQEMSYDSGDPQLTDYQTKNVVEC